MKTMSKPFYILATILAGVLLASCNQRAADLVPDTQPQVAVASINGVDTRNPSSGSVVVPANSIYPVDVFVTASDEQSVAKVELFVNGEPAGVLTPTKDGKPVDFKNPFIFRVNTFSGNVAKVRAVATDGSNQTSEFELDVAVDSTRPVVDITSVTGLAGESAGSLQGSVVVNYTVSDPESGITDIEAFFDDTLLTDRGAFIINVEEVGDGAHFVSLVATNGAGVIGSDVATFVVDNPEPQPAPTPTPTPTPAP
jgi:hypothetical protein